MMSERPNGYDERAVALNEGLFVLAFWTLVWGPVVAVALLQANKLLLLATPIVFLTGIQRGKLNQTILKYRPLVIVIAAFFTGYFWYAYVEQGSDDFKSRVAAFEACSKFKACADRVQLEGFDIGLAGQ